MKRSAIAQWLGSGKDGSGQLSTDSGVLKDNQYSYLSRFESGIGTNPEELVAAAHAGCFSMKLSFVLGAAGFTPAKIETKATVTLENGAIPNIHLDLLADIPGITKEAFLACAEDAKANCPISKLLATEITLSAHLA